MEVSDELRAILRDEITLITSNLIDERKGPFKNPMHSEHLRTVIDRMGELSAVAQQLKSPITSFTKVMANPAHRLYILRTKFAADEPFKVLGLIKVGVKKLFIVDSTGELIEMSPLCVLDFYVHDTAQRSGHGLRMFKHMLIVEKTQPHLLGYDRPSHRLMSFLKRHFNLMRYTRQPNNFVVFHEHPLLRSELERDELRAKEPDVFRLDNGLTFSVKGRRKSSQPPPSTNSNDQNITDEKKKAATEMEAIRAALEKSNQQPSPDASPVTVSPQISQLPTKAEPTPVAARRNSISRTLMELEESKKNAWAAARKEKINGMSNTPDTEPASPLNPIVHAGTPPRKKRAPPPPLRLFDPEPVIRAMDAKLHPKSEYQLRYGELVPETIFRKAMALQLGQVLDDTQEAPAEPLLPPIKNGAAITGSNHRGYDFEGGQFGTRRMFRNRVR